MKFQNVVETPQQITANNDMTEFAELQHFWGMSSDEPLLVLGRLVMIEAQNTLFFLTDLTHPTTGLALRYPDIKGESKAFILPREGRELEDELRQDPQGRENDDLWALAELQLSPLKERRKHDNPKECSVRKGSLRRLVDLPTEWNITRVGPQNAPKIMAFAREALDRRLKEHEDNRLKQILHNTNEVNTRLLERQEELSQCADALRRTSDEWGTAKEKLAKTRKDAAIAKKKIKAERTAFAEEIALQRQDIEQERAAMEEKMDALKELFREKGERLVALELLDREQLEATLPAAQAAKEEEPTLGLDQILDRDFTQLAALLQARLWQRGMTYALPQLQDFLALLRTSDFIVLAGDSGSGKSSLVKSVADSIGARCTTVAVKPNWTGPEDLLGYYNPIERKYQMTPFLQALLAAGKEPDRLHFILLDEMNLARVEHYFADFLSLLETRDRAPEIPLFTSDEARHVLVENGLFLTVEGEARLRAGLPEGGSFEELLTHDEGSRLLHRLGGFENAESVLLHHARLRRALSALVEMPQSLTYPPNVRIIGAINVDDTTHELSPKVLDRAHVLRFGNPLLLDWVAIAEEINWFDETLLTASLQLHPKDFGPRTDYPPFDPRNSMATWLVQLAQDYLDPLGVEFGLRALRQSLGYLQAAEIAGIREEVALDNLILHKVLPKIAIDLDRNTADGRPRREVIEAMAEMLEERLSLIAGRTESSVKRLERMIVLAEHNNGIANYWFR